MSNSSVTEPPEASQSSNEPQQQQKRAKWWHSFAVRSTQINKRLLFRRNTPNFRLATLIFRGLVGIILICIFILMSHYFQPLIVFYINICDVRASKQVKPTQQNADLQNESPQRIELTHVEILCYILQVLAIPGTATASGGYWLFLFKYDKHSITNMFFTVNAHLFTLILLLIDYLFFSGVKFHPLHFIYPFIHVINFIIFALFYWLARKIWIYGFLDFNNALNAGVTYPLFILGPELIFLLLVALGLLRDCITKKCNNGKSNVNISKTEGIEMIEIQNQEVNTNPV